LLVVDGVDPFVRACHREPKAELLALVGRQLMPSGAVGVVETVEPVPLRRRLFQDDLVGLKVGPRVDDSSEFCLLLTGHHVVVVRCLGEVKGTPHHDLGVW
jgi:hypothetical protein